MMVSFFNKIRHIFNWFTDDGDPRNSEIHTSESLPTAAKRLRLTMSSDEPISTLRAKNSSKEVNIGNTWIDPNVLRAEWEASNQSNTRLKTSSTNINNKNVQLTRNQTNCGNVNIEARDRYKNLVLNSAVNTDTRTIKVGPKQLSNTSTKRVTPSCSNKPLRIIKKKDVYNQKDVIHLDSDSDDDIKIIEPLPIKIINKEINPKIVHVEPKVRQIIPQFLKGKNNQFEYNCLEKLRISEVISIDDSDSDVEEIFILPKLTRLQEERVQNALTSEPEHERLITKFKITITRGTINCLYNLNWLNDEIINFYLCLIMERSESDNSLPRVYVMNTFFLPKIMSTGQESVKRWTRRIDIFSYDLIMVPYNKNGMHWCLITVDLHKKSINFYDSLGSADGNASQVVLDYLADEFRDKKQKELDTKNWKKINVHKLPQQLNGADCGVFTCTIAEFLCRNCALSFSQKDMPYFRRKICLEIIDGRLIT